MAQRLIELSCKRFAQEISEDDDKKIRSTSLEDVRLTVTQIERKLASQSTLRNLGRLTSYLNAVERYSKSLDALCNGVPFLPYIWAPVKFILIAVHEHTQILDKMLSAYAQIGSSLPWLSRLRDSFQDDRDFQQLFAFLYEDITEFHRKAYALIRKPAWKVFFSSAWGQFEHRFGDLIESITRISTVIDREASSLDILKANEWRRKALEDSEIRQQRWASQQTEAVMKWLDVSNDNQELKLEWLKENCCAGTGGWIIANDKFRSWLQRGRGNPTLWIYGKPGSGKSVLASQIISFLRLKKDTHVLFFFCDFYSTPHAITASIFKVFVAQIILMTPEMIPFLYDEFITKRQSPSMSILKGALVRLLTEFSDIRLLVDGIDELPKSEHKTVINELVQLAKATNHSCRLLILSQDLPSIRPVLSQKRSQASVLYLGDQKLAINQDIEIIIESFLIDLDENLGMAITPPLKEELRSKIFHKAEGMLLWVRLVFSLLETSASLAELRSNVDTLPEDLGTLYEKILSKVRLAGQVAKARRIFGWLIYSREGNGILKYEVLNGMTLGEGSGLLNRENRPFPTALDVCKPLIEDGPNGTVAFIHSTVIQYLLSRESGPFISRHIAHRDISCACLLHLIQILDFLDSEVSESDLMIRTGLGIFGLQLYANEHWIYHFLEALEVDVVENEFTQQHITQDTVQKHAQRLCTKHSQIMESRRIARSTLIEENFSTSCDPRLNQVNAEVQQLIYQVLNFRKALESQQRSDGPVALDVNGLDLDTTLFSKAHSCYRQTVQDLLKLNSYQGLSQEELFAFRANYRLTLFTCPVRNCERFRIGFDSAEKLEDHKRNHHAKALRCYLEGCTYNDVGFASSRSLRDHQRKQHGKTQRQIPSSIRRPPKNDSLPSANSTQPIQKPAPRLNTRQIAALTLEQGAKYEQYIKGVAAEDLARLRAIGQEVQRQFREELMPTIDMSPQEYNDTATKLQSITRDMNNLGRALNRWYRLTRDDTRARIFFRARFRVINQFLDGDSTTILKDTFSIRPAELEQARATMESMAKDLATSLPNRQNQAQGSPQTQAAQLQQQPGQ